MDNKNELATQADNLPATEVNPDHLLKVAVDKDLDITKLEKLMELQERFQKNQARRNFFLALAKFQSIVPELEKSKLISFKTNSGGMTKYKFAPLGEIEKQIKQSMFECGLSKRWEMKQEHGRIVCTCHITHVDGHTEITTMEGEKDTSGNKNSMQQNASAVTYLQRYTLIAALGLTTADEDNDAQGSGDDGSGPVGSEQSSGPETPRPSEWLNEDTLEWTEAETKLKSGEWKLADVETRWKVNKKQRQILQGFQVITKAQPQQPAMKEEPKKEEVKNDTSASVPLAKTVKPKLTDEHKAEYEDLVNKKSLFKKGEVNDMVRVYNRSMIALATGDISLSTITNVYDLDPDVLAHFESVSKRK